MSNPFDVINLDEDLVGVTNADVGVVTDGLTVSPGMMVVRRGMFKTLRKRERDSKLLSVPEVRLRETNDGVLTPSS